MRRFGTKTARFNYAVSLGLLVATVGFMSFGPLSGSLFATESFWDLFAPHDAPQVQVFAPSNEAPQVRSQHKHAHRHAPSGHRVVAAMSINRQSLCVRSCDGYSFPVGAYHGEADRVAHEAICQSACPDAATTLFVLPAGSDKLEEAISLKTGQTYSALPGAFHYTTLLNEACTCHKARAVGRTASLLRDFTLRRGDAIMTTSGVKVFHGQGHFPYNGTDFVALSRSQDVRKSDRATFGAIERASLKAPAGQGPELVISGRGRLQQQASR